MISSLFLIIITVFRKLLFSARAKASIPLESTELTESIRDPVPPLGVFLIAGCGADFLINLCLTLLG